MKAQKLAILCAVSTAVLVLAEVLPIGADLAAYAQPAPQPMAGSMGANSTGFAVGNDQRRGRHKRHRRHRRGHKRGMNKGRGGAQANPWNGIDGSQGAVSGGGQGRRHRRHRGGRKRRMMQMNGGTGQDFQPGGRIGQ